MLKYRGNLKPYARRLRAEMTESEQALWWRLRRNQLLGVQFYRQKAIGSYIVDFYAPKVKLVLEVDGSQHLESDFTQQDAQRDAYLMDQGLRVLRFSNLQVLQELDAVVAVIFQQLTNRLGENPPLTPLCPDEVEDARQSRRKGGMGGFLAAGRRDEGKHAAAKPGR